MDSNPLSFIFKDLSKMVTPRINAISWPEITKQMMLPTLFSDTT